MDSGKPTLINAVIDSSAGTESGRIGNLNPKKCCGKQKKNSLINRCYRRNSTNPFPQNNFGLSRSSAKVKSKLPLNTNNVEKIK